MRKIYAKFLVAFSLSFIFLNCLPPTQAIAQYDDAYISYNDFFQNLAPYGQWIEDPKMGYVWSPEVEGNFRPYYTNGHWAMTDYGNTWVSDYAWGWACFHYGRWTFDSYYGWLWVPGSDWGPAWVAWRKGEGYYGWAPLTPEYKLSAKSAEYTCPGDWWVFIPPQYLYTGNYYRYWNGPRNNKHLISNSDLINNTYSNKGVTYVAGPHSAQVAKTTGKQVLTYKLVNSTNLATRVHHEVIKMYRPAEIRPTTSLTGARMVPPNVIAAPQGIGKPQTISSLQTPISEFRRNLPPTATSKDAIGTHVIEAEKEAPKNRNITNPYEWDINKPVAQPEPPEREPAPVKETKTEEEAVDAPAVKTPVKKAVKTETTETKSAKDAKEAPAKADKNTKGKK